ncbi:MAG TPA: thioredoxin [Microbacteriaceae bacterium]|jgi:thioredoxin 1|nr:thioredoxin [Microbacteriaceae bacterium]
MHESPTSTTSTVSPVVTVTDATFQAEVLQSDRPVIVDFWAEWCPPCRAISPILEQLAIEHPDALKVVKVNADENLIAAQTYRALALPTMKVFVGGEVVKTIVGAKPKRALEAELGAFLIA